MSSLQDVLALDSHNIFLGMHKRSAHPKYLFLAINQISSSERPSEEEIASWVSLLMVVNILFFAGEGNRKFKKQG